MADAARFVADFPGVTFVLVHAGMLDSMDSGRVDEWKRALADYSPGVQRDVFADTARRVYAL